MNNFGLFELFSKLLTTQKDILEEKNVKKEENKTTTQPNIAPPLPYKNSAIISLITKHNAMSKKIDDENKKS